MAQQPPAHVSMAAETGGYRSYFEAYQRRHKGAKVDALFVDKGALRAVLKKREEPIKVKTKMIDRESYTEFLEEQLERVCLNLLKAEEAAEAMDDKYKKLEGEVMVKREEIEANLRREIESNLSRELEKKTDEFKREFGEFRSRLETATSDLIESLKAEVHSLKKGQTEMENRLEKEQQNLENRLEKRIESKLATLSSARRVDDLERSVRQAIDGLTAEDTESWQRTCAGLAKRVARAEKAARDVAEVAVRHADERTGVVVDAIAALERRVDTASFDHQKRIDTASFVPDQQQQRAVIDQQQRAVIDTAVDQQTVTFARAEDTAAPQEKAAVAQKEETAQDTKVDEATAVATALDQAADAELRARVLRQKAQSLQAQLRAAGAPEDDDIDDHYNLDPYSLAVPDLEIEPKRGGGKKLVVRRGREDRLLVRKKKSTRKSVSALKAELRQPIGPQWPDSVMHCGPMPRAWVPAVKVGTPRLSVSTGK